MSTDEPLSIISTREFPFPKETLYTAFSDPTQLPHWWGPKGFTNTFEKFDLRPGGEWLFVMHGPNGANYPNRKQFIEVAPERIAYKHFQPTHTFTMVMDFETLGANRSRLTWHMDFVENQQNAKLKDFIIQANEENFDRLAEHLESRQSS